MNITNNNKSSSTNTLLLLSGIDANGLQTRALTTIATVSGEVKKAKFSEQYHETKNSLEMRQLEIQQNNEQISDLASNNIALQMEIADLEAGIENLSSELLNLKFIATHKNTTEADKGPIQKQIEECNETINQYKSTIDTYTAQISQNEYDISEFKANDERLASLQKEDTAKTNALEAQIFNVQEKTSLKKKLIVCEARLQELHLKSVNQIISAEIIQEQEAIKFEMKNIIKEMIHSEMLDKLKKELKKPQNDPTRILQLEDQIKEEIKKSQLQKDLKEAQSDLATYQLCLTFQNVEDTENIPAKIKETESLISDLCNKIKEITVKSRAVLTPVSETPEINTTTTTTTSTTPSNTAGAAMTKGLIDWLSENMLKEGLKGDVQEVIVTAALLHLATTNTKPATASAILENNTDPRIKRLVLAACDKFCMGQVIQYMVSANPAFSAIYGLSFVTQHFIFGDAQMSTLIGKVKTFIITESIKTVGITVLGGVVAGTTGTLLAIPAAVYSIYKMLGWYNHTPEATDDETESAETETVSPSVIQNISDAGIDLIADSTVEMIFANIMK